MGYTTDFFGEVSVDPPFNEQEMEFLRCFSETRRMRRKNGPYYAQETGDPNGFGADDILDINSPPPGQPGLWCNWTPTSDTTIGWNGGEKFYHSVEWMEYLIAHFIGSDPEAKRLHPEEFAFLQGHTCNGEIEAQGEDISDRWLLVVDNNKVSVKHGTVIYEG